jgi:hypothetical protein
MPGRTPIEGQEIRHFLTGLVAHFGFGVTLRDQPRANGRRHFADSSRGQPVEADAFELAFPRRCRYTYLHVRNLRR